MVRHISIMMALGVDIAIIIPSKQRWSGVKKGKSCNYQRHYPEGDWTKRLFSARYTLTEPHLPAPFKLNSECKAPVSGEFLSLGMRVRVTEAFVRSIISGHTW